MTSQDEELTEETYTTEEVAEIFKLHPMTVAKWRYGHGDVTLPFMKLGNAIRYRREDIEKLKKDSLQEFVL